MLFVALLILFLACFLYLARRNLLWGMILIVAFPYSYLIRFQIFDIPMTVLEAMILAVFVLWLNHKDTRHEIQKIFNIQYLISNWFLAIVLFLVASTISVFISPDLRAALGIWKAYFIEPALLFLILVTTVKNRDDINKIIWGLVLGALPVAILAIIQKFTGWLIPNPFWAMEETRRVTSVFGYPNAVALYLAPILPFAFYLMKHETWNMEHKMWKKCSMLCAVCFMLLAIIFAKSTGALMALTATTVFIGLIYKKSRYWVAGAVVLFLLVVPLTSFKEPLSDEILLRGRSGQIRLAMWGETVEMLRSHPILGAGLAGYQKAVEPYHILNWAEIYLYPHNLFLNFWTEIGLAGLVGFLWLVLNFFRFGFRKLFRIPACNALRPPAAICAVFRAGSNAGRSDLGFRILGTAEIDKKLILALMASMSIILIHGLVDVPYFKNDLAILFWLLLGIVFVAS